MAAFDNGFGGGLVDGDGHVGHFAVDGAALGADRSPAAVRRPDRRPGDPVVAAAADAHGAGFVDVRAVSVTFPDDLADAVHPAQAWSDRITAAIVRHLQPQP